MPKDKEDRLDKLVDELIEDEEALKELLSRTPPIPGPVPTPEPEFIERQMGPGPIPDFLGGLGDAAKWYYENVTQPFYEKAGGALETAWEHTLEPSGAWLARPILHPEQSLFDMLTKPKLPWETAEQAAGMAMPPMPRGPEIEEYRERVPWAARLALESVPLAIVPGFQQTATWLKGTRSPWLASIMEPAAVVEKGLGKAIEAPFKLAGKGVRAVRGAKPPVTPTEGAMMPEGVAVRAGLEGAETVGMPPVKPPTAPPTGGTLESVLPAPKMTPGVLPKMPTRLEMAAGGLFAPNKARTVAQAAYKMPGTKQFIETFMPSAIVEKIPVLRNIIGWMINTEQAASYAKLVVAPLRAMRSPFLLDDAARITNIQAKGKGASFAYRDVFEHPSKYVLTKEQMDYINLTNKLLKQGVTQREAEGIFWGVVKTGEEGRYVPSMMRGKLVEGELMQAPGGISVGRLGTRGRFAKSRGYETMEETIQAGWLPNNDIPTVMEAYFNAHYRAIANQRLKMDIRKMGQTATERLKWMFPDERTEHAINTFRKRAIERADMAIKRAIRGEAITAATVKSIRQHPQVGELWPEFAERLSTLSRQVPGKARVEALREFQSEVRAVQQQVTSQYWRTKSTLRTLTEKAGEPRVGMVEGKFLGRIFDKKTAEMLNKAYGDQAAQWLDVVSDVNAVARFMRTGFDVGAPMIQGLPMLARNPKIWGEATYRHLTVFKDPIVVQQFMTKHYATVEKMISNGAAPIGSSEFMEAGGLIAKGIAGAERVFPGATKIVPKVARIGVTRFQESFNAFIDMGRILYWESLEPLALKKGANLRELANHVDKAFGVTSSRQLGVSQSWQKFEATLLFAPRYFRSWAGLTADMAQGGFRGAEARKVLASMMTVALLWYTAKTYAEKGEITAQDYIDLAKDPSKALTLKIAGQHVGPGSTWVWGADLLAEAVGAAYTEPEKLFEPSMSNPLARKVRGKFSPMVSLGWDIVTGRNYIGESVDVPGWTSGRGVIPHAIESQLVPFWVEGMIEQARVGGTATEIALGGVTEIAGMRQWPVQAWEERKELRNKVAQEAYSVDWYSPEMLQRDRNALYASNTALQELDKQILADKIQKGDPAEIVDDWLRAYIKKWKYDEREALSLQLLNGEIDKSQWNWRWAGISSKASGMYEAGELVGGFLDAKGQADYKKWREEHTNPKDKAVNEYYDIEDSRERERYLASLPISIRQYVVYMVEEDWKLYLGPNAQRAQQLQGAGRGMPAIPTGGGGGGGMPPIPSGGGGGGGMPPIPVR